MLADLKAKLAEIDRKRVYTAAAALLIAGAAGHFMQRSAGKSPDMIAASVPAPAPVTAPETIAPVVPAPEQTAEATPPATLPAATDAGATIADAGTAAEPAAGVEMPEMTAGMTPDMATAPRPKPAMTAEAGMVAPEPEVTRATTDPLLGLGSSEPAPTATEDTTEIVVAAATEPDDMTPPQAAAPAEPMMAGCDIDVRAEAKPGALLGITVTAPCDSGGTVAFEHAGLRFSEQLGPDGSLKIDVPAMTGDAVINLVFDDGSEKTLRVPVPDFAAYDRIALVWKGATGLQVHALEGGAGYGEPGHVWADAPASPGAATSGEGGFLSVLGSAVNGYAADVYTYPAVLMERGVEPEVSIEAQVMENTCGGEIDGWILRSNVTRKPTLEPLRMIVPDCDAVGEFLVLKDLPMELKLARR